MSRCTLSSTAKTLREVHQHLDEKGPEYIRQLQTGYIAYKRDMIDRVNNNVHDIDSRADHAARTVKKVKDSISGLQDKAEKKKKDVRDIDRDTDSMMSSLRNLQSKINRL
eukprot:TRINITY_DN884_c0_g1_i2.p2 TRINITY_DN884_c0_g1~~TRINITY_DN884_c0_g1_i2.p2  ORF type:complete len:110 (+),score=23.30 TRINITY_DN884_c0_g1_i2:168-497(+)